MADHASADKGGKLSLIGVFDTIFATEVPVIHRQFYFVSRLRLEHRDQGTTQKVELTILDEDHQELMKAQGEVAIGRIPPGQFSHATQVFEIRDFKFEKYGRYRFRVVVNEDKTTPHDTVFQVAKPPR